LYVENKEGELVCPVCGTRIVHREGCKECPNCGYSFCEEA
jgi:ribosomal protein L37AE/L43A